MVLNKREFNFCYSRIKMYFNLGVEPDFFIVGAQKCGTTSLFNYIEEYSENFKAPVDKELYFFSENYHKGIAYYKAKFPIFKQESEVTGEATPDYLYYHNTSTRIYNQFPNAKIVVVLRDPIERAYSQYHHQNYTRKTVGYDPLSFSKAIRKGRERFDITKKSDFFYEYKYYSYVERGFYTEQITRYFDTFGSENVYVMSVDEINDFDELTKLFKFLGLTFKRGIKLNENIRHNANTYDEIDEADYLYLKSLYKSDINKLSALINKKFIWMDNYQE